VQLLAAGLVTGTGADLALRLLEFAQEVSEGQGVEKKGLLEGRFYSRGTAIAEKGPEHVVVGDAALANPCQFREPLLLQMTLVRVGGERLVVTMTSGTGRRLPPPPRSPRARPRGAGGELPVSGSNHPARVAYPLLPFIFGTT
jgi:hypothetical protein